MVAPKSIHAVPVRKLPKLPVVSRAIHRFLMGGPNYEIVNNSEDMGIKTVDFRPP